jgi:hypothetical protein
MNLTSPPERRAQDERIKRLEEMAVEVNDSLKNLKSTVDKIDAELSDFLTIVRAGRVMGKFVKWASVICIAFGSLYVGFIEFIKYVVRH